MSEDLFGVLKLMKLTGQRNQCPTCGRYFARTSGFAKHRVGKFGDGPLGTSPNRRCMTEVELEDADCRIGVDGIFRFLDNRSGRNPWAKQNAEMDGTPS